LFYTKSLEYTWNWPHQPPSQLSRDKFKVDDHGKILNPTPTMAKSGDGYVRPVVCRDWWDDIPIPSGFSPWKTGKKIHRWQKPEKLLQRIIAASSNPGDIIVDLFLGSGTTGAVAKRLGRRWLGFEIDPEIAEIARQRIYQVKVELLLF